MKVYAVNTDKIFLFNEEMQTLLVDKVNLVILRDTQFSNINTMLGTRFIKNEMAAGSSVPFIVATDGEGVIRFSQPTEKVDKLEEVFRSIVHSKGDAPPHPIPVKRPFVQLPEEEFEGYFNEVVERICTLCEQ